MLLSGSLVCCRQLKKFAEKLSICICTVRVSRVRKLSIYGDADLFERYTAHAVVFPFCLGNSTTVFGVYSKA